MLIKIERVCGILFRNHVTNHEWVMYTYRTNWLRPDIARHVVKHLILTIEKLNVLYHTHDSYKFWKLLENRDVTTAILIYKRR